MPHDAYVRIPADGVERLHSHVDRHQIQIVEGKPYCRIQWEDATVPESWLRDTSRVLGTDTLWLAFQKQVDALAFQHWSEGGLKRRLAYGVKLERVWESVDGVPEPWEADALFSPRTLARRVKVLEVLDITAQARDKMIDDLKRIWAERRLEVGVTEPTVSAGIAGPAIVRHYDLPEEM